MALTLPFAEGDQRAAPARADRAAHRFARKQAAPRDEQRCLPDECRARRDICQWCDEMATPGTVPVRMRGLSPHSHGDRFARKA